MASPPRSHRFSVLALVLAVTSSALGYGLAFFPGARVAGAWALAMGLAVTCPALIAMSVTSKRSPHARGPGALLAVLALLALFVAGGFAFALLRADDTALLFGLPRATVVMWIAAGVVPLIALPIVYAAAFDDDAS